MSRTQWRQLDLQFHKGKELPISKLPSDSQDQLEAHRKRIVGYLTMRMPNPVDVVFTNNRSTMISFRQRRGRLALRLHRLFRHADETILDHLSRYIIAPRKLDSEELDRFIAAHKHEIERSRTKKQKELQSRGRVYDLIQILSRVCETYFDGVCDVRIGWGNAPPRRKGTRRRKRTISRALATYNYETRTIKISPVLDAPNVPQYVIEWIVYHEMLHHVLPVKKQGGKHRYHTRQFRLLERAFIHYDEAKKWEQAHLEQLLF